MKKSLPVLEKPSSNKYSSMLPDRQRIRQSEELELLLPNELDFSVTECLFAPDITKNTPTVPTNCHVCSIKTPIPHQYHQGWLYHTGFFPPFWLQVFSSCLSSTEKYYSLKDRKEEKRQWVTWVSDWLTCITILQSLLKHFMTLHQFFVSIYELINFSAPTVWKSSLKDGLDCGESQIFNT